MRLEKKEIKEVSSMRIRRTFSDDFKRQTAEVIISGQVSQLELSRKYGISPVIISRWKKEYLSGKFFENKDPDYAKLEIRVKELERMVGKLTMENSTLKEIIKLIEPQKKDRQQIFTSKDWKALKRGADK
jgi:transposase